MEKSTSDTWHFTGTIIRIFSPRRANGGVFSLAEYRLQAGAGSPVNRHPGDDESFYVLSGQVEIEVEGKAKIYRPGGFVQVPNGAWHRFANVGREDATMLVVNAPGLVHESFFAQAGRPLPSGSTKFPVADGPRDVKVVEVIANRCGIEFAPPG